MKLEDIKNKKCKGMRVLNHDEGLVKNLKGNRNVNYRIMDDTKKLSIRSVILEPKQYARYHAHKNGEEIYIIISGCGIIFNGNGKFCYIESGNYIHFEPGEYKMIGCCNGCKQLHFMAITTPPMNKDTILRKEPPIEYIDKLESKCC